MKILFSDYDGTIKTFIKKPNIIESRTLNLNIKAINPYHPSLSINLCVF